MTFINFLAWLGRCLLKVAVVVGVIVIALVGLVLGVLFNSTRQTLDNVR